MKISKSWLYFLNWIIKLTALMIILDNLNLIDKRMLGL